MKNELEAVFTKLTTVTPEPEDYTGDDGLLYCGKCRTPKEAYHTEETRALTGHDKRPSECDCQRAKRLEREAAEQRRKHLQTVDDLKNRGFTDPKMRKWTFENDNGSSKIHYPVQRFQGCAFDSQWTGSGLAVHRPC